MLKLAATYAAKRTTNDKSAWHALTRGLRRQAELNRCVASDLLAFKWLYLLTNAPFFYVGHATLRDGHAAALVLRHIGQRACSRFRRAGTASVLFHGIVRLLAVRTLERARCGQGRHVDPGGSRGSRADLYANATGRGVRSSIAVFVLARNGAWRRTGRRSSFPRSGFWSRQRCCSPAALSTRVVVRPMWHVASARVVRRALRGVFLFKCPLQFGMLGTSTSRLPAAALAPRFGPVPARPKAWAGGSVCSRHVDRRTGVNKEVRRQCDSPS